MSSPTDLFLPHNLPYPIKVLAHAVHPSSEVQRGTRLLDYSFTHVSKENGTEIRFGTWDSSIEGTLESWAFQAGETVSERRAREIPAVKVTEPCTHGMQLSGLCCLCGKDMTSFDYTGFSDASRASIQMTHAANGPTVSLEEAQRIERETADHLRKHRKLSLIVDLDQTIVHATVDPTVGEWIAEGEAWEARHSNRNDSQETMAPQSEDEVNPNWEALKDVKKFRLGPEALGQPYLRGIKGKGKDKSVESEGCMYYIKPRPGWEGFLEAMATKYEMHVYTMGTRAYAEEVCAAIDPDGKIFGGRLLSRDESGSLTQKSLQRLFPCDQSMVVIIDDRADVWEWSPNLVKVIPYDFFVGIGDINSAFLPKLEPLTPTLPSGASRPGMTKPPAGPTPPETAVPDMDPISSPLHTEITPDESVSPSAEEEELAVLRKSEILARNAVALDAQVEQRPLAKMQEELQEEEDAQEADSQEEAGGNGDKPSDDTDIPRSTTPKSEKHVRKALLKNDDVELNRVQRLLEEVHQRYYDAYDHLHHDTMVRRKPKHRQPQQLLYDVRNIIPQLRQHTLEGTQLLFSSVIPLDTRPESTEIWRMAQAFGATCYTELNSRITHVVAAKRGTVKVDAARRQGGIKIVWLAWFTDSIALWQRQDETPYLIDPEPVVVVGPASPPSDTHQISSDPEPDADDWDDDRAVPGKSLALDEVDWDEVNDEVDAAMNESDEDDDDMKSTFQGSNASEDDWTDESISILSSASSTPRKKRKRLRSITPSDVSTNGHDDSLRSPLAKRKKMVANRSGTSKLKEAITADDLEDEEGSVGKRSAPASANGRDEDEEMEEDDDTGEDDDDFLARELGEDWG